MSLLASVLCPPLSVTGRPQVTTWSLPAFATGGTLRNGFSAAPANATVPDIVNPFRVAVNGNVPVTVRSWVATFRLNTAGAVSCCENSSVVSGSELSLAKTPLISPPNEAVVPDGTTNPLPLFCAVVAVGRAMVPPASVNVPALLLTVTVSNAARNQLTTAVHTWPSDGTQLGVRF